MLKDVACTPICGSSKEPSKISKEEAEQMMQMIADEYHVHLCVFQKAFQLRKHAHLVLSTTFP